MGEKAKPKRKFPKVEEIKKPLIIGSIVSAIAIAGIVIGINFIDGGEDGVEEKDTLTFGFYIGPQSFDPFWFGWLVSKESAYLFDQVAEGLFEFDIRNKTNPIINNLAKKGEWSTDGLNFTCTLREGVKFHDETSFNATAVKWNIDRVIYFINNKPWNMSWWVPQMWYLPDGVTPIINETKVIDEYTVRFVLNKPYVLLESLLLHYSSYMLSPTSTPFDRLIDIRNETMVGTGPFTLDSFNITLDFGWLVISNTTLKANHQYWNGKPEIDKVIFLEYFNDTQRWGEMISGNLSFTYSEYGLWEDVDQDVLKMMIESPDVNVFTLFTAKHHYILMHNERINTTMRKAISYAYNYTRDFEIMYPDEYGERLKSYIPHNFLYANWTAFDVPDYNVIKARQVLKDANWPGTALLTANGNISAGNEWELIANSPTPLATYNTSNGYDRVVLPKTAVLLNETLKQIGVKLHIVNMSGNDYYDYAEEGKLDFARAAYIPDYNDPDNIITPFFSNGSIFYETNWMRLNDPWMQQMIKNGTTAINPIKREQIYYDIQEYLIEESYPHLMLFNSIQYDYWNSNVGGVLSVYRSEYTSPFKDLYII